MKIGINRKIQVVCVVVCVMAYLVYEIIQDKNIFHIIVMIGSVITIGVIRFGFYRCPKCNSHLGRSLVKHCTNCGVEVDVS
jgi:hypothetical protein